MTARTENNERGEETTDDNYDEVDANVNENASNEITDIILSSGTPHQHAAAESASHIQPEKPYQNLDANRITYSDIYVYYISPAERCYYENP